MILAVSYDGQGVLDRPNRDHIFVHLLQLFLGSVEGVGRRIEVVGLEALVGELDLERLVIFLEAIVSTRA